MRIPTLVLTLLALAMTSIAHGPTAGKETAVNGTPPQLMPNDCLLLAMEAEARMERVSTYVAVVIASFADQEETHAACLFRMVDGSLWIYDRDGSYGLRTKSTDPKALRKAIAKAWGKPVKGIVVYEVRRDDKE